MCMCVCCVFQSAHTGLLKQPPTYLPLQLLPLSPQGYVKQIVILGGVLDGPGNRKKRESGGGEQEKEKDEKENQEEEDEKSPRAGGADGKKAKKVTKKKMPTTVFNGV